MNNSNKLLQLNVGFIVHQTVGYSRDFPFEFETIKLPPDLELQGLAGIARVTRTAQGLLLQVDMRAAAQAECVRCLESFMLPLQADFTELYAFTPNSVTESGLILPENGLLDLSPPIREEMILAFPIKPLCKPDCKGLCPICGENRNTTPCNCQDKDVDPRLDTLKSLLKDGMP